MIFRSPLPDVVIPDTALTPLVLRKAGQLASKPALIDGPSGRALTLPAYLPVETFPVRVEDGVVKVDV